MKREKDREPSGYTRLCCAEERLTIMRASTWPETEQTMNWVLFFLIATVTPKDHFANTATIPMASEELCNAAKAQLKQAYDAFQSPYSVVLIQCLKTG